MRLGDRGHKVRSLQEFLTEQGHLAEPPDGVFGVITEGAVIAFQTASALAIDGIAGPDTQRHAWRLGWVTPDRADGPLAASAADLGLEIEILAAFTATESGGQPDAIRFEPHLFIRAVPDAEIPYTRSQRGAWSVVRGETDRRAFDRAYRLDAEQAVRATSWGLFQVLGGHLLKLWPSPAEAVVQFMAEPEAVSHALLGSWMRDNPKALEAAKRHEWVDLARLYNGPGKANHYAGVLARNYRDQVAQRDPDPEGDRCA